MLLIITHLFLTFFSFGSAEIKAPELEKKCFSDSVKTDSSRLVTIGAILIQGNAKTKDYIILRELELKKGDTVRLSKLEKILAKDRNRIYNTRLFNSVKVTPIVSELGMADIYIEVQER